MKKPLTAFLPSPDLLLQTLSRFSPTLLFLVVIFFVALAELHNIDIPGIGKHIDKVMLSLVVSTGLSIAITFVGESRQWREATKLASIIMATVGIFLYYFFTPYSLIMVTLLLFAITGLLILVSPSLIKGDDASFWLFNRDFYLGTLLAASASTLFGLAILMGLLAIEKLFGADRLIRNTVGELWLIIGVLMIPAYALSWAPTKFKHSLEECNGYPALTFAINWLLIPIATIYLVILYAYFGKIAITQELPKSILSSLIIGFSVFAIAIHMISWPMIKTSKTVALFSKFLFPLLVIPVGFLWYSIVVRVGDYGITEQRYLIICTAAWISLLISLYFTKKISLRIIPVSLSIILVFATFSPFNIFTLSKNSQEARLETLLQDNDLLTNGMATKSNKKLDFATRKNISNTLSYLLKNHDSQKIKKWFSNNTTKKYGARELTEKLGFKFVYKHQKEDDNSQRNQGIYFFASSKKPTNIENYQLHTYLTLYKPKANLKIQTTGNTITLLDELAQKKPLFSHSFDVEGLKKASALDHNSKHPIELIIDNDTIAAKLIIYKVNIRISDKQTTITNIEMNMFYRYK